MQHFTKLFLFLFVLIFKLGQWGGADFGSAARNDKFLRLMGAFKKPSATRQANDAASGPSSGGRCMTKGTEESLTRRLEKQYEAAMDCSRNKRGLGLGYNPDEDPNNKTFYIDKTASKSVKL